MTPRASGLPVVRRRASRRALLALLAGGGLLCGGCAGGLLPKPAPAPARFTLDGAPPRPAAAASAGTSASTGASTGTSTSTGTSVSTGTSTGPRTSTSTSPNTTTSAAPVLVVGVPRAAPGYDSPRMVYLRRPQEIEAFARHEWVDTPAAMLAPLLVRAVQDGGGFRAVLLAPSSGTGAWRLDTELIRLHQDFSTRPSHVRLSLRAVLVDSATRQVIAWREFDQRVDATSDDAPGGAAAAQAAAGQVLDALAAFCAAQIRR